MSEEKARPSCPRCRAPMQRVVLPSGVLGLPGELCVDCSDGAPTRQQPWACPACGTLVLLDT